MAELAAESYGRLRNGDRAAVRIPPSEGWLTLLLHVLIIAITANSVLRVDQSARSVVLVPMAIGGLMLGLVMARTPALDAIAHLLAVFIGIGLTLVVTAVRTDGIRETWHRHGMNVVDLAERIVTAQFDETRQSLPDDDLIVIIALTLWLIGYSSAWMLYRRHWLAPALTIPAALMVVSLKFDDDQPTRAMAAFSLASLVMAARHHAFVRQIDWARSRIPAPRRLSGTFTIGGSAIAAVALIAGYVLPYQAPESWSDRVSDRVDGVWQQAAERWNEITGDVQGEGFGGNYSQFDDSFRIGEEFVPSNDPVASLSAVEPTYLVARHYDRYDGTRWASDVDSSYRLEGQPDDARAPAVNFQPNQSVPMSSLADQEREWRTSEITLLTDKNGLILTTDIFAGSNLATRATLGWQQLNGVTIDIASVDITTVPTHFQSLVLRLREAEYTVDPATGRPAVAPGPVATEIELMRAELLLLPLRTSLEFGLDNRVLLVLDGRVPNYDDIDSVFFAQRSGIPTQYRVSGSISIAGEDVLRAAGADYPDWVEQRYLQLPGSLTDRTVQLGSDIVAQSGATNPFDAAWAIQQYLRGAYQYAENSQQSPDDADAVDFFLFEKSVGRCEDYAGAMVVLLRTQGIPARMAAGYRTGDELTADGDFLFLEKQAHTWVEVYFPDYGWVPFEPTAIEPPFDYDGEQSLQEVPEQTRPEMVEPTPTPEPTQEPELEASPVPVITTVDTPEESTSLADRLSGGLAWITIGLTVIAAIVVGGVVLVWAWGLRGLRPGAALYAKTIRIGRLWGVEPHPTMTPREYAAELGQTVPGARRAVSLVADLYAAEAYGGIEVSDEVRQGGNQAWRALRRTIVGWRPWRRHKGS
ncbi:MAG: transglutaminase domain-containing protein [Thermomicrobiales bacterium]|nr:transglutaminase domain-containing protein [Thermomicrobiales bacterium]